MRNIWNRKVPTILALVFITATVLGTTFLVQSGVIFFSGAAPSENPQNVRVTNISDTNATITYTTDAKVIGTISMGQDKNSLKTILDERDQQSGNPQLYRVHSISIKNLLPGTAYIFSITSGTTTYLNHDAYFTLQTAPKLNNNPSSQNPVSGKLVTADGNIPGEALVYVTADKGELLSTLTKASGIYTIPLNTYKTADGKTPFVFQNATPLHILATDGTSTSQATVLLSGSNPIPLITLSQTYNFTTSLQPLASDSAAASIGFPAFSSSNTLAATPVIITPKKNEAFTDAQPRFSGKALPNQTVTIEIHSSQVITGTVTTDTAGNWTYRPTQQLSPGNHTLTVMTKDANGILHTIEQSFTVFAAGSQVDQSATPSAQPTITIAIPTPTPTIQPSSLTPTLQPTLAIKTTPSVTPRPTLPPTGSNTIVVAGTTGIVTTVIGIVLFLISRGTAL